ncbi:hypothetical protein C1645_830412 [Glomus cerebriforme]|uniref:DUF659 domain-containing protein n=1 Tax=Glomus cerebriforme TaxID=658196 RepID=A0A397SM46_9GLOM|nr:hypothetical protein C1645_830412 [Glomus cerebriforme]
MDGTFYCEILNENLFDNTNSIMERRWVVRLAIKQPGPQSYREFMEWEGIEDEIFINLIRSMPSWLKQQHNFHPFFTLIKNPNNSTNALAVCNYYISKHGSIAAAQIKPECYTVNYTRFCYNHLAKCLNFHEYVDDDEVQKILALSIPENNKMKRKAPSKDDKDDNNIVNLNNTEENQRRLSTSSSITQLSSFSYQSSITTIIINNGKVLTKSSEVLQENIIKIAKNDQDGQPLIWDAYDISAKRSKTEDVIRHIEKLMSDANKDHINIKAFISDSAGEYAAARDEQMRIYQKTITLITPGDTRWNSYYFCFHFILKTKSALKFLSAKFNDSRTNVTKNNEFWSTLFELQNLLYLLCGFLNKLQKDTAQLHEVLHCFADTTKILDNHHNFEFSSKIVERMESCWKEWEQSLLILFFALHSSYKLQKFHSSTPNLTWTYIG